LKLNISMIWHIIDNSCYFTRLNCLRYGDKQSISLLIKLVRLNAAIGSRADICNHTSRFLQFWFYEGLVTGLGKWRKRSVEGSWLLRNVQLCTMLIFFYGPTKCTISFLSPSYVTRRRAASAVTQRGAVEVRRWNFCSVLCLFPICHLMTNGRLRVK
jgi:hypothetical protein